MQNNPDHRPVNGHRHDAAGRVPVTNFAAWEHSTLAHFAEEANAKLAEQDQRIAELEADIKLLLNELRQMLRSK